MPEPFNQVVQLETLRLRSDIPRLHSEFTEDEWVKLNGFSDAELARRISQGWALLELLYNPEIYNMTQADAKMTQDSLRRQIKEIENILITRTEVQNG
jgi:hypothetical protein